MGWTGSANATQRLFVQAGVEAAGWRGEAQRRAATKSSDGRLCLVQWKLFLKRWEVGELHTAD
jgi:hypothetical protein